MSALSPHIKALRAEGNALSAQMKTAEALGDEEAGKGSTGGAMAHYQAAIVCGNLSAAKYAAADALEVEDQELIARFQTGEKRL